MQSKDRVSIHAVSPDTGRLRYEETDLSSLQGNPVHFVCGIYLVCVRGECTVSTGAENFLLSSETELIFLAGTLLERLSATADFKAKVLFIPKGVYLKAMLPIDTPYLNYADEHPCYKHTGDVRSRMTWKQVCVWMDTAKMLFSGHCRTQFPDLLELDYLQAFLIWLFGTVPEKLVDQSPSSRMQLICRHFLQLLREHASQLIEDQLLSEVQVLLNDLTLTVTEIAARLHFPDQSYLTRFFKRRTGMSPREYRQATVAKYLTE